MTLTWTVTSCGKTERSFGEKGWEFIYSGMLPSRLPYRLHCERPCFATQHRGFWWLAHVALHRKNYLKCIHSIAKQPRGSCRICLSQTVFFLQLKGDCETPLIYSSQLHTRHQRERSTQHREVNQHCHPVVELQSVSKLQKPHSNSLFLAFFFQVTALSAPLESTLTCAVWRRRCLVSTSWLSLI